HIMESAYNECYLPMIEVLESHGGFRTGFHISGTLLEWFESYHPEYLKKVSLMCRKGQMELLTSGRYEPILPIFRRFDIIEQISSYSDHLESLTGIRPEGLWLSERVWEPQLPSILCEAGISYAVVDDFHLQKAGIEGLDLFHPFVTEDAGKTVRLLGSNRELRYMIPFASVEDTMKELERLKNNGAALVFYGDDGEKFGVWPGTNELCYDRGWLDSFLSAIESAPWLEVVLPSSAVRVDPSGPVYIPAASYSEMGEWISEGFWRNFLSAYPESKELHGRILEAEKTVRRSRSETALHHFWRSQCNCSFWHGVFGGIYLPHLREAVWKELHSAEREALRGMDMYPFIGNSDIDADGKEETIIVTESQSLLVHPEKGLTVSEFSFLPDHAGPVPMGHVLSRRHEKYHDSIPGMTDSGEVRTIHDGLLSKEDGLAERIVIDRWRRVLFSDLVMVPDVTFEDWKRCDSRIISFQKSVSSCSFSQSDRTVDFTGRYERNNLELAKDLHVDLNFARIAVQSMYSVNPLDRTGMEICLNLMTGNSPDRCFRIDSGPELMMGEDGTARGKRIEIIDRWRKVMVIVDIDNEADIWFAPLESVNRSESGYERVHQGAAVFISSSASKAGHNLLNLLVEMKSLNDS
ncbi:MAG: DUF1926 domain-containing protein, partial [Candidatus Aegiribacteria sp.]|nr:DUF1926 domain-containing protein [Candidatus Aegiribacteria sp.]